MLQVNQFIVIYLFKTPKKPFYLSLKIILFGLIHYFIMNLIIHSTLSIDEPKLIPKFNQSLDSDSDPRHDLDRAKPKFLNY